MRRFVLFIAVLVILTVTIHTPKPARAAACADDALILGFNSEYDSLYKQGQEMASIKIDPDDKSTLSEARTAASKLTVSIIKARLKYEDMTVSADCEMLRYRMIAALSSMSDVAVSLLLNIEDPSVLDSQLELIDLYKGRIDRTSQAVKDMIAPEGAEPTTPPIFIIVTATHTPVASSAGSGNSGGSNTFGRPVLTVIWENLNIRPGPGTNFAPPIGAMKKDDTAIIVGRNQDASWWVVEFKGLRGWVTADTTYSKVEGDTSFVPVEQSPATPIATAEGTTSP